MKCFIVLFLKLVDVCSFLTCFFNFYFAPGFKTLCLFQLKISLPVYVRWKMLIIYCICYFMFYWSVDRQHRILCDIEIIVFLTFIHRSVDRRHHLDQWGTWQPTGAVSGDHWWGRHSVGHHWGRGCSPAPGNHWRHLSQQLS